MMTYKKPSKLKSYTLIPELVRISKEVSPFGALSDMVNSEDIYKVNAVFKDESGKVYAYNNELMVSYYGETRKGHRYTVSAYAMYVIGNNMKEFIVGEGFTGNGFRVGSSAGSARNWLVEKDYSADAVNDLRKIEIGDHGIEFYETKVLW
jgi:hypothetical protein